MPEISGGGRLGVELMEKKKRGNKLLIPYVTGGLGNWREVVHAVIDAGADAVEVGIPFSDPIMDGPTIQEASQKALEAGATPSSVLSEIGRSKFSIPVAVMTYYNIVHHAGHDRFAQMLADSGVSGVIIPDLQLDEAGEWMEISRRNSVDNVLLAAPSSGDERLKRIVASSRGFVYGVGVMGVTGERNSLAESASVIASRLKRFTDMPVLVGVGVSSAEQASIVSSIADGVIVGSALVRRLLADEGADGAYAFVVELRKAVDRIR